MTDTTEPDDEAVIRPFGAWLREIQAGSTHDELSEKLHELTEAVVETGKKGTLQLTITMKPMKNSSKVLMVDDVVKMSLPARDRESTIFFPDRAGNLSRKDPNQLEIPTVAAVPDAGAPIRIDDQETAR